MFSILRVRKELVNSHVCSSSCFRYRSITEQVIETVTSKPRFEFVEFYVADGDLLLCCDLCTADKERGQRADSKRHQSVFAVDLFPFAVYNDRIETTLQPFGDRFFCTFLSSVQNNFSSTSSELTSSSDCTACKNLVRNTSCKVEETNAVCATAEQHFRTVFCHEAFSNQCPLFSGPTFFTEFYELRVSDSRFVNRTEHLTGVQHN